MIQSDRSGREFCAALGHPEWKDDARFKDFRGARKTAATDPPHRRGNRVAHPRPVGADLRSPSTDLGAGPDRSRSAARPAGRGGRRVRRDRASQHSPAAASSTARSISAPRRIHRIGMRRSWARIPRRSRSKPGLTWEEIARLKDRGRHWGRRGDQRRQRCVSEKGQLFQALIDDAMQIDLTRRGPIESSSSRPEVSRTSANGSSPRRFSQRNRREIFRLFSDPSSDVVSPRCLGFCRYYHIRLPRIEWYEYID